MRMRRSRVLVVSVVLLTLACLTGLPAQASAQTPFVPYFFQNNIRYDKFDWHIYKTDHFEIYYYPEIEQHLERVSSYAESAYQHISSELKHDLASRVPLIIFKTESEFQEQHVNPGELPEAVLAFAEPEANRMVLPIDEPSDRLYELITHELTHIFEFDIIPRGIIGGQLPLWMDEGLSDYMAGAWNPLDLMTVRDAALTDNVPRMSEMYSAPMSGRAPYELGHATWEFIESKWGKEGLRQFIFSLRKNAIGGGESAYEEALKVKADDFDDQFDRYLKDRFKAFRDKERPADYGRNLAPRPDRTDFVSVDSLAASPSGEMLATLVANAHDQEFDIILLSAKDGQIIRNLTRGFDKDRGFQYISVAGGLRGNLVPWIAWAPVGDRIAYFVRTEKQKTLVVQNVVTGKTEQKAEMKTVDAPESPAFSPDGSKVAFAAMQGGVGDIFIVDLPSGEISNLTSDEFADYAPTYSPDGRSVIYAAHISGNDKLFQIDLATKQKKQLTFGTHDDMAPTFLDDHTIVFTSTATDPNVQLAPEVARNGQIPNVWSLDLTSGQLKQYTDTATGNVSPVVLHQESGPKIAFVSYYKGDNGIHIIEPTKPVATVASSDFGAPGPVIDFQPPISQPLMRDNIHKKGAFEKMTMIGRPPVNVGVTSGGTFYGNTEVAFADVLGDKQISFYAQSVSQFRTTAFSYLNIEHRMQYALQGFSQDLFYYGQNAGVLYDPVLGPIVNSDRQLAEAVQSSRGGTAFAIYPFNRYTRVELFTGYMHLSESVHQPGAAGRLARVPGRTRPPAVPQRLDASARHLVRAGDIHSPPVRSGSRPGHGDLLQRVARPRERLDLAADPVGRPAALHAAGGQRRPRRPPQGPEELGRAARLHVLRRQLRAARLRLPVVPRPQGLLRGRRAAVPPDRRHAHAAWRARRAARRDVRGPRRRRVQRQQVRALDVEIGDDAADPRIYAGCVRQPRPELRPDAGHQRLPAQGRPGLVRPRARDAAVRPPDALRLVLADPVQQGLGGFPVRARGLQQRHHLGQPVVPLAEVRVLDRL